jgi:hypothetical protein
VVISTRLRPWTDDEGAGGGGQLIELVEVFVCVGAGASGEVHAYEIGSLDPRAGDEFKRALQVDAETSGDLVSMAFLAAQRPQ